ncbi:uncharacterized protein K452DRAFT_345471 [Aplosporella prunicola CBS 121167]|uniref:GPR1/FUN34/yaaH family protein n=1 Tax=Aplosporella prunicola CBS 121167 TaxID=1176127 RepID=A0A6A6BIS9_9PEZI|nr:uncharacterized protein K452DRAFT_345471 [Aplosporella prunicola CBS 121167]KAF2144042.1 hypothetical protein K452DRAFT_345471 [Aplosporella prunicola CBS 121167]
MVVELVKPRTKDGHLDDRSQPALPVVHRSFANPAPLGLLSFATVIFLMSTYGVSARVTRPNGMIGVLLFSGGVCQFISGIMEFISGNTFGATLFPSYAAFNLSFAMIWLPGTGIMSAYIDSETKLLSPEFSQAMSLYFWAWFILTVAFTVAAIRSSWVLFSTLFFLAIVLLLMAVGHMLNDDRVLTAAYCFSFVSGFFGYWAGCAGLWAGGITPIDLPTFQMHKQV